MVNVLVSAYAPFNKTLCLALEPDTELSTLPALLASRTQTSASQQRLSLASGRSLPAQGPLSLLSSGAQGQQQDVHLRLSLKLLGGKGGFGSQLRAAGGRMSTRGREQNTDSCRDLSGRRLSSVKEAQKVAQYVEGAEERERQRKEAQAKRLEELNGQVNKLQGGMGKKRRNREPEEQDDDEKTEERREKGKSAIMAAMMKKRKKNTSPPAADAVASGSSDSTKSPSDEVATTSTASLEADEQDQKAKTSAASSKAA